jgi:hypothetical protein
MAPPKGVRQARHHLTQATAHRFVGQLADRLRTTDHGPLTTDFQGFASPPQPRV